MQTVHNVHTASYILIWSEAREGSAVLHNEKQLIEQVCQGLLRVIQKYHRKESCFSAGLARLRLLSNTLDCELKLVHR